jgi:hypothetical protein
MFYHETYLVSWYLWIGWMDGCEGISLTVPRALTLSSIYGWDICLYSHPLFSFVSIDMDGWKRVDVMVQVAQQQRVSQHVVD